MGLWQVGFYKNIQKDVDARWTKNNGPDPKVTFESGPEVKVSVAS